MAAPALSLKGRALRWLAQREHSRAELARKLRAALQRSDAPGPGEEGVEPLLDELEAKGFLSDQRAAESLLAAKGSRFGPLRLRQAMQSRGFNAALIDNAVAHSREGELDRARAAWQRKFDTPPADARERARQARFLAARGFSAEAIARVLRGAASAE